jgi:hypothetical protein
LEAAMTPVPPPTALQQAIGCAFECFHDAHERLDGDAWAAYVEMLLRLSQREATRLAFGEALRALREDAVE